MQNNRSPYVLDLRRPEKPKSQIFKERLKSADRVWRKFFLSRSFLLLAFFVVAGGFFYFLWSREFSATKSATFDSGVYHVPQKTNWNGLNLVFLADEYPSWEEFDNDVDKILIGVQTVEPWKSYKQFNIYKIYPGEDIKLCQVKTENERKPVLRCDRRINTYFEALKLNRAKFIVFSRKDFQSWANVARLDDAGIFFSVPQKIEPSTALGQSYLMLHLLGHAFGLKDEEKYVIARAEGAPHAPDGPNCAPDKTTAEKWWGDLAVQFPERVGYFSICAGSDDYIKPTKSSFMNFGDMTDFVPDYGPVSERYLSTLLKYCFSAQRSDPKDDAQFFEQYPEFRACLK